MILRIKKLDERASVPTYGTEYSAGADLYSMVGDEITVEILDHSKNNDMNNSVRKR